MRRFGPFLCAAMMLPAATPKPSQRFQLPNGLQVRLVEDHDRPLVRLQFRTSWDPKVQDGGVGILARLLVTAGAGDLNRETFQRELEENALSMRFQAGSRTFTWSMLSTSQTLDPAVQHLAMMVSRPLLDAVHLESLQRTLLEESRDAREKAEVEFLRSLGDPLEIANTNAFQLEDLLRLRRRILRPEQSILVLQGDLNLDQAKQVAALNFGAWGPGVEPVPEGKRSAVPSGTRCWCADASGHPAEIRLGSPMPGSDSRQHLARTLAARMLRRELAAGSVPGLGDLTLMAGPEGPWVLQVVLKPGQDMDGTLAALQALLAQWRGRVWTESDLTIARRLWSAEILASALHPWEQVEGVFEDADPLIGLESVKPGDIRAALLEWLEPTNLRWLFLGNNLDATKSAEKVGVPLQKAE